jgi:hypothetical protein
MDPITLATIAVTLIATKATEKVGEKIGEQSLEAGGKLLAVLRRKAPETVMRLAAGAESDVIDVKAEVIEEMKRLVAAEPEVQTAVAATVAAIATEGTSLQQLTKLAEKIGVVNLGTVEHQTNNITL